MELYFCPFSFFFHRRGFVSQKNKLFLAQSHNLMKLLVKKLLSYEPVAPLFIGWWWHIGLSKKIR